MMIQSEFNGRIWSTFPISLPQPTINVDHIVDGIRLTVGDLPEFVRAVICTGAIIVPGVVSTLIVNLIYNGNQPKMVAVPVRKLRAHYTIVASPQHQDAWVEEPQD